MQKIPLEDLHKELGASFGEFAGWRVPMSYEGTLAEHMAVRRSVGVFDISHMGRLVLRGDVLELIERVYTKKMGKTRVGFMSGPTLALNAYARVKDDEMYYRVSDDEWLVVPNAAVRVEMYNHLRRIASELGVNVEIRDVTMEYAMLAIQGPESPNIMEKLASWAPDLRPLEFRVNEELGGIPVYVISRSGWTGEDGFEVWARPSSAAKLLRRLIEMGVKPVGIAARDTLRIEAGFVLGGHEYGEDPLVYPCALGLRYGLGAIDWGKTGYIGWEALRACRREGARWVRVGLVMKKDHARVIPRQGYRIFVDDVEVGWVTSGTFSPVIRRGVGQAYIDPRYDIDGMQIEVDARGRRAAAKIQGFPLVPIGTGKK